MEYKIRLEEEKDFREVEELTREAFWNLYVPGCDEHYLVHKMRSHPDFIKDLAFVAELDGKIVANIMYTKAALIDELGRELEIATFGPLCVHPSCQRQGLGGALIGHTKKILIAKGIKAIVILGDSHNYCKHGFKSASDYGISDADGGFPSGMLALELEEKALAGHAWKYKYSDVYILEEKDAAEFDTTFPEKKKEYKYTQERFSIAIRSFMKPSKPA